MRLSPRAAALVILGLLVPVSTSSQERTEPVDSGVVEKQVVELAEVRILVTDRRGKPIVDLQPDEIRVYEAAVSQRVAFLENVSGGREEAAPLAADSGPNATSADENRRAQGPILVLPPKAVRRVILAFDVDNSRKAVRERWRDAAMTWASTGMHPGDRVGLVILGDHPQWLVELTDAPDRLESALEDLRLKSTAVGRDRSREMSMLMSDIRECLGDGPAGETRRGGGVTCAYDVARPRVHRWNADAEGSLANLEALVGQLAAIPGRKAVLLFSDGFIVDPSMMAVHAIVATIGSSGYNLDMEKMRTRFGKDVHHELAALHHMARAADVTFFSLDTRHDGESGFSGNLEHDRALPPIALGVEPWRDMGSNMAHGLELTARETGGASYDGVDELEENLRDAADSFFGMYTVGYYRANPDTESSRIRVMVEREHGTVSFPDRGASEKSVAEVTRLELVVGNPRIVVGSDEVMLPLAARMALSDLPLRKVGRQVGTVLGIYFRATRADGTIVDERLDPGTISFDSEKFEEAAGSKFMHRSELRLPPGSYRVLVRVSDDRQRVIGGRVVDLTLGRESVRRGLGLSTR